MTSPAPTVGSPICSERGTVLVVDDAQFCREMVAAALRSSGYEVVPAVDGYDALRLLADHHVDIAVLDYNMPRMGGVELLKILRTDSKWRDLPVIMLTDSAAKDVIVRAGALGVCGYMLKANFSLPELLMRVEKALASPAVKPSAKPASANGKSTASSSAKKSELISAFSVKASRTAIPHLIARDVALAAVKEFSKAKAFKAVAATVMTALNASPPSTQAICAAIKQDPVISTRILSAAASLPKAAPPKPRLNNIEDAVRLLGIPPISEIVASIPVFELFTPDKAVGLALYQRWLHALAVSAIMTRIVPKSDSIAPGLPAVLGLCHELPDILLQQHFPSEFSAAVDFATQMNRPVHELFPEVFGVSVQDLAETLFKELALPPSMVHPLLSSIQSTSTTDPAAPDKAATILLTKALAVADAYAIALLLAPSKDALVGPLTELECRIAMITNAPLNGPEIRSEIVMAMCIVANVSPDQEKILMEPMFPMRAAKIWYARHVSLSRLDPLEAALKQLCIATVSERLPRAPEFSGLSGLLIAVPDADSARSMIAEATRVQRLTGIEFPILCLIPAQHVAATLLAISNTGGGSSAACCIASPYPIALSQLSQFTASLEKS